MPGPSPEIFMTTHAFSPAWMRALRVEPEICADAMKEWGLSGTQIEQTTIEITERTPTSSHDLREGVNVVTPKFAEVEPSEAILSFHLGSAALKLDNEGREPSDIELSRLLLEGISRYTDTVVQGVDGLAAENAAALNKSFRTKNVIRTAGPIATGSILVGAVEALSVHNHLLTPTMNIVLGVAGAGITAFGTAIKRLKTHDEKNQSYDLHEAAEAWPYQLRARERANSYIDAAKPLPVTGFIK